MKEKTRLWIAFALGICIGVFAFWAISNRYRVSDRIMIDTWTGTTWKLINTNPPKWTTVLEPDSAPKSALEEFLEHKP